MPHPQAGERYPSLLSSSWAPHPKLIHPLLMLLQQPLVNPRTVNRYYVISNNVFFYSAMLRSVLIRTINVPSLRIVPG